MLGDLAWLQISPGYTSTCGIVDLGSNSPCGSCAGAAYCCGANDVNQLGIGSPSGPLATPVPVAAPNFTSLRRQLAAGASGERELRIAGPLCFVSVSTANNYTCGVDVNGGGFCWGWEVSGGTCSTADAASSTGSQPIPTAIITVDLPPNQQADFAYVDVGDTTTCFISFSLPGGPPSTQAPCVTDAGPIVPVGALAAAGGSIQGASIASSSTFFAGSAAMATLRLWAQPGLIACFGANSAGVLGIGVAATAFTSQLNAPGLAVQPPPSAAGAAAAPTLWIAVAVFNVGDSSAAAYKNAHACGLAAGPGSVLCWGSNSKGQLGAGLGAGSLGSSPVPIPVVDVAAVPLLARAVACGFQFTCAIAAADNSLACFGDNTFGQLGDGASVAQSAALAPPLQRAFAAPVVFANASGGGGGGGGAPGPFAAVSAGGYHACALTYRGRIFCWGLCASGQCGSGAGGPPFVAPSAQPVAAGAVFAALACGAQHTCAVDSSGAAWCWGRGAEGQLGRAGSPGLAPFSAAPAPVFTAFRFYAAPSALSAGMLTTCGIETQAGRAVCWGARIGGGAGSAGADGGSLLPAPIADPGAGLAWATLSVSATGVLCGIAVANASLLPGVAPAPYCLGSTYLGAAGSGDPSSAAALVLPAAVATAALGADAAFSSVSAGSFTTCAAFAVSRAGVVATGAGPSRLDAALSAADYERLWLFSAAQNCLLQGGQHVHTLSRRAAQCRAMQAGPPGPHRSSTN